jgi:hypothetical protein
MAFFSGNVMARLASVLVLGGSLFLTGCASSNSTGNKEAPVLYGNANGVNGAVGAATGMSFSW